MEKFSVLISVYYREKGEFLREALRSVFEQTVPPNQVVLVKDGPLTSELDSVIDEFVVKYDRLKVVGLPENVGLGMALNAGLDECDYELIARMDSDDISIPNRFELQLKEFELHPQVTIIGGWIDEFTSDPKIIECQRRLPETSSEIRKFARSKSPVNHMTVMFRKSDILAVGSYQHFYLLEDYWLWIRLLYNGYQFRNIQQPLVLARGGIAMTARRGGWRYAKSEINLQRKMLSLGFINFGRFVKNCTIRFTVRMMPNRLRSFFYKKILR